MQPILPSTRKPGSSAPASSALPSLSLTFVLSISFLLILIVVFCISTPPSHKVAHLDLVQNRPLPNAAARRPNSLSDPNQFNLIFAIHPGRVGSVYITELLQATGLVRSFHQIDPQMNGEVLDMVLQQPLDKTADLRREMKIPALRKQIDLAIKDNKRYYAETSSMFIKTYHDIVMEAFLEDKTRNYNIYVIAPKQWIPETVESQYLMQWLFGDAELYRRREVGYYDLSEFSYDTSAEGGMPFFKENNARETTGDDAYRIDRLISYNFDIEMRAQNFKKKWAGNSRVKVIDVAIKDLNTPAGVHNLLGELGLLDEIKATSQGDDQASFADLERGLQLANDTDRNAAIGKFLDTQLGSFAVGKFLNSRGETIFKQSVTQRRILLRTIRLWELQEKRNHPLPEFVVGMMPSKANFTELIEWQKDRTQRQNAKLPAKMSQEERKAFYNDGTLPERYRKEVQELNK